MCQRKVCIKGFLCGNDGGGGGGKGGGNKKYHCRMWEMYVFC